jgi:hypothetical protein
MRVNTQLGRKKRGKPDHDGYCILIIEATALIGNAVTQMIFPHSRTSITVP